MDKIDNLWLYEKVRSVPKEAQKPITGGRLNGKTDINPMWRIKTLTEQFGPCGIGWKYEIKEKRIEEGYNGEKTAFVDIDLYIKVDGKWSEPIPGTGGSMFVAKEKSGLYTSDECFKMACTDAISVACKMLGIGADVYWQNDPTKYQNESSSQNQQPAKSNPSTAKLICAKCKKEITKAEHDYSIKQFKYPLCKSCQALARKAVANASTTNTQTQTVQASGEK